MTVLRALLNRHPAAALLLAMMTLAIKALVPAGYMIESGVRVLTVAICADSTGEQRLERIAVPAGHQGPASSKADGASVCPFASLAAADLGGTPPTIEAVATSFRLARGFAPAPVPQLQARPFLRPPLRAPPVLS